MFCLFTSSSLLEPDSMEHVIENRTWLWLSPLMERPCYWGPSAMLEVFGYWKQLKFNFNLLAHLTYIYAILGCALRGTLWGSESLSFSHWSLPPRLTWVHHWILLWTKSFKLWQLRVFYFVIYLFLFSLKILDYGEWVGKYSVLMVYLKTILKVNDM